MGVSRSPQAELVCGWEPIERLTAEPNIVELILEQEAEFSALPESIPLDLDIERMRMAEQAGLFRMWGARLDGLLVGLIEWNITPPLHHRSTLYAFDGGHYLAPEYRSVWTHFVIWRQAVAALRELGVKAVMAHDNPRRPMAAFFARLGFEPAGQLYLKVL